MRRLFEEQRITKEHYKSNSETALKISFHQKGGLQKGIVRSKLSEGTVVIEKSQSLNSLPRAQRAI